MAFTRNNLILAACAALALFLLLAVLLIWWHKRRPRFHSKYGFTAAAPLDETPEVAVAPITPAQAKLQKFMRARGEQVADVLLEYVKIKESTAGVYRAQPTPDSCVWWMGEQYPSHPKGIIAAVMAGPRRNGKFRTKVVVLNDLPEVGTLVRALGRAAKPKTDPTFFDAWNMPIAFSRFPLQAGDGVVITELARSGSVGDVPPQQEAWPTAQSHAGQDQELKGPSGAGAP